MKLLLLSSEQLVRLLISAIVVCEPANQVVKFLTKKYRPKIIAKNDKYGLGGKIGIVERLIILLLLSVNEYTAIGFIIAAKSLARFDQLKDKEFAEYYIYGTLCSVLIVILVKFIIM